MSISLFDLTGTRALVTGSSQGIGLSLAKGLAAAGATIVLNGRSKDKLDEAVATASSSLSFDRPFRTIVAPAAAKPFARLSPIP